MPLLAVDELVAFTLERPQGRSKFLVVCDHASRLVPHSLGSLGLDNLGDIGLPPPYAPMDFAGWFEAYLGGSWHTFDARNNTPRIGRILLARGRDAADVAISTAFGENTLTSFRVWTDQVN